MRTLNLANYATFYESIKNGYISEKDNAQTTPAPTAPAGPKNPAAVNLVINTTDSEALKAIKTCIRDMEPAEAYKVIEDQSLALSSSTTQDASQFSVKIGDKDIKIVLRKLAGQVNGKTAIKPAFDSVSEVIAGMDIDYICTQIHEAISGVGTDEDSLAAIGGAVIAYSYDKKVAPKEVWTAVAKRYKEPEMFGEDLIEAITDDFTGNPKVFAKGMFGGELTADDFTGAAWGELATDPLLWGLAIIQVGTTALTFGAAGPEWVALDSAILGAGAATASAGAEVAIAGAETAAAGAGVASAAATGAEAAAAGAELAAAGAAGAEAAVTGTEIALAGAETFTVGSEAAVTGAETASGFLNFAGIAEDMVLGADGVYYSSAAEAAAAGTEAAAISTEAAAGAEAAVAGAETAAAGAETAAAGAEAATGTNWLSSVGGRITVRARAMANALKSAPQKVFTSFRNLGQKSPELVKQILAKLNTPTAQRIIIGAALTEIGINMASIYQAAPPTGQAGVSSDPESAPDRKAAAAVCRTLHDEAKGWTPESGELKIAALLLQLNPATWKLLNEVWQKNYGKDGDTLYSYCIDSELSGDLLTLVNGYLAGLGATTDASEQVSQAKDKIAANAVVAGEAAPIKESFSVRSFKDFLAASRRKG